MIYFALTLKNPFATKHEWIYDDLVQCEKPLTTNKTLEYSYGRPWKDQLFMISISTYCTGQDHAGPEFELGLLGWQFSVSIRDNRHWNHDANRWNREDEY